MHALASVGRQPDVPVASGDTRTKLTPRSWEWSITVEVSEPRMPSLISLMVSVDLSTMFTYLLRIAKAVQMPILLQLQKLPWKGDGGWEKSVFELFFG